jgi:Type III secretion protein (HpaP)
MTGAAAMGHIDTDRARAPGEPAQPALRSAATQRFEDALRRDPRGDGEGRQGEGQRERTASPRGYDLLLAGSGLPAAVLDTFRESLMRGLPALSDRDRDRDGVLDSLLQDIADGVRAGRTLPGDRWRVLVRLRAELLPATEVDVSCAQGLLVVTLRTADEDAYRAIVAALPRLNRALSDRLGSANEAVVYLVPMQDLQ